MRNFNFWLPTRVILGKECIEKNKAELMLGKKALIVTGRHSAKASGALSDIVKALDNLKIEHVLFDDIEENPSLETVERGGLLGYQEEVDFVIGIGGGSPLDAAKAIAALVTNQIPARELFTATLANRVLPIVAIPTTAGTGSEVTPYAILTDTELETKRNFSNRETFPTIAFLDAKYTTTLSDEVTINTAMDFLSHALEGYLSVRSTTITDHMALEVFTLFKDTYPNLLKREFDQESRDQLLYASMVAGIVIAQTGTCMVHGIGYPLTYYGKIPHGRANALLMGEFLSFSYEVMKEKIDLFLDTLGVKDIDEFIALLDTLLGQKEAFTKEELRSFAKSALQVKSIQFSPKVPGEEDIYQVLIKSLGEG